MNDRARVLEERGELGFRGRREVADDDDTRGLGPSGSQPRTAARNGRARLAEVRDQRTADEALRAGDDDRVAALRTIASRASGRSGIRSS